MCQVPETSSVAWRSEARRQGFQQCVSYAQRDWQQREGKTPAGVVTSNRGCVCVCVCLKFIYFYDYKRNEACREKNDRSLKEEGIYCKIWNPSKVEMD